MKNFILGTLCALALVFVLGSAGSLEHNTITLGQFAIRGIVGAIVVWATLSHMDI